MPSKDEKCEKKALFHFIFFCKAFSCVFLSATGKMGHPILQGEWWWWWCWWERRWRRRSGRRVWGPATPQQIWALSYVQPERSYNYGMWFYGRLPAESGGKNHTWSSLAFGEFLLQDSCDSRRRMERAVCMGRWQSSRQLFGHCGCNFAGHWSPVHSTIGWKWPRHYVLIKVYLMMLRFPGGPRTRWSC